MFALLNKHQRFIHQIMQMTIKNILFAAAIAMTCTACTESKTTTSPAKQEAVNINKHKESKKMKVQELTTAMFQKKVADFEKHPDEWVFEGDKPAVIDFYATWCGPCKATAPIVEELAQEYDGKIDFYKVDVDKEEVLAALFGIRSIPSLLFIPKNGEPKMQVGAMNKIQFKEAIKSELLK